MFLFASFQGALLLTEVLKERDAQIDMKNSKLDADKIRETHLLRLQQRVSDLVVYSNIKEYIQTIDLQKNFENTAKFRRCQPQ